LIFGNKNVARKLKTEFKVHHLDDITDEELARIYSEANLTVCPQKWETFGYTVAESICCGTPVIAFNCMGTGEILSRVNNGFLANNQSQLLDHIKSFTTNKIEKSTDMYPWDIVFSTKELDFLIQKYCNYYKL
jgi:glycosyltransferase involved in cell wall biosynthesis